MRSRPNLATVIGDAAVVALVIALTVPAIAQTANSRPPQSQGAPTR